MADNTMSNNNESSKTVKKKAIESDLPLWERVAILVVWSAGAAYMCYSVFLFSKGKHFCLLSGVCDS